MKEVAGDVDEQSVLDAALIAAAQTLVHPALQHANCKGHMLGRSDCASRLHQNLAEEKATDSKLNTMAPKNVNRKAA